MVDPLLEPASSGQSRNCKIKLLSGKSQLESRMITVWSQCVNVCVVHFMSTLLKVSCLFHLTLGLMLTEVMLAWLFSQSVSFSSFVQAVLLTVLIATRKIQLRFYFILKDLDRQNKWPASIRRDQWEPIFQSKLCNKYFVWENFF